MSLWWEEAENGQVPDNALEIGENEDGETLYIGRAFIDGDLVPGRVHPSKNACFVGCNNHVDIVTKYEVLVSDKKTDFLEWVPASDGEVPEGAVVGGKVGATGETLYIARAHIAVADGWHGGKLHASQGCAWIPYNGSEHKVCNYEVLVDNS